MDHVLIIHAVADYDAWKRVFDQAVSMRRAAGERHYQLLRFENDANKVVHLSGWTSIADARAFFESRRLVDLRRQAGVQAPEFHYLHKLEAGLV